MKHTKPFIALVVTFFNVISAQSFARDDSDIDFEVIAQGGLSGVDHQMSMVVDNMMHWEHLWKMHTMPPSSPTKLPEVDFESEIVVAQFLGPVASCGYDIQTQEVEQEDNYIKVETLVTLPNGPINCLIAESPFEFIKIPRTGMLVSFEIEIDDE